MIVPVPAVIEHNRAVVAKARRFIVAVMEAAPGTRFTVHYEGFGSGGMAGVLGDGALSYLEESILKYRWHTKIRIERIDVRAEIPEETFSA